MGMGRIELPFPAYETGSLPLKYTPTSYLYKTEVIHKEGAAAPLKPLRLWPL